MTTGSGSPASTITRTGPGGGEPRPVAVGDRVRTWTRPGAGTGTVVGLRPTPYGEPEAEIRPDGDGGHVFLFQTAVFGYAPMSRASGGDR
jgi:hypothetical protein